MDNQYIKELIQRLDDTEIWKGAGQMCKDYDEGIRFLTDTFLAYKKDTARVFFIGNGGSAAIASHMTADFMKNGGMNTYSLYDSSVSYLHGERLWICICLFQTNGVFGK